MFKLRYGYLISGIITGSILLFNFIGTLPDGKLHIFFCNVGQGDAAYIKFPDGRDMVVDGGPDDKVVNCLSRHMPFWDRHIDMVALTHPQKDHLQGLISVISRYQIGYVLKSNIANSSEGYDDLMREIAAKKIPVKLMTRGQRIVLGDTSLSFLWPSPSYLSSLSTLGNVLGSATDSNLNDGCLVFSLRYGSFDALLPGDADQHVEHYYTGEKIADGSIEVLKVPHHGSKTGMTQAFIDWVRPRIAVISVGKNTFGHPTPEAIAMLQKAGSVIHRTDKEGDIEVVSDGRNWMVKSSN
jgi:competence protein ComEC